MTKLTFTKAARHTEDEQKNKQYKRNQQQIQ